MKIAQAIKHLREGKIMGLAPPLNTWFKLTTKGVWIRFRNHVGGKWAFYGTTTDLKKFDGNRNFVLPYYGEQYKEK